MPSFNSSLLIILSLLSVNIISGKQLFVRFDNVDRCGCGGGGPEDADVCIMRDFESRLHQIDRGDTLIDSWFEFSRDIERPKLVVSVQRCLNKESLDSCEVLTMLKPSNTCEFLKMRHTMWEKFIYAYEPPLICPFKKGKYIGTNSSLNADIFHVFPIDGWYWKIRLDWLNHTDNSLFWSFCMDFAVIRIR